MPLDTVKRRFASYDQQYAEWKAQNGLAPEQKVFLIKVEFRCDRPESLIDALSERGWVENSDKDELGHKFFDFFWSVRSEDVPWEKLQPWQIVNHTQRVEEFTRKILLYRNLRDSRFVCDHDVDDYLPRSYDLSDGLQREEFCQNFKCTYAQALVQRLAAGEALSIDPATAALQAVARQVDVLANTDDALAEEDATFDGGDVLHSEWCVMHPGSSAKSTSRTSSPKCEQWASMAASADLREEARSMASQLDDLSKSMHPQLALNGPQNLWVLKPGGLSRGRGVSIIDSLSEATRYFNGWFTVQKYQENPLLITRLGERRKHDIRQYTLIESWEPLRVWFAPETVIRFAAQPYDFGDRSSKGVHLTNTAIGKQWADNESLQCSSEEYAKLLMDQFGFDVYHERILPQMRRIVTTSASCLRATMKQPHAGQSYELVGYDFCVSDDFRVWLLEVNEMPSFEAEGFPAFQRVVHRCMRDTLRVMLKEPCPDSEDAFFNILIEEPALVPLPLSVPDLTLHGVGYGILAPLRKVASDPALFRDNQSVRAYLDKIARRKQKDGERVEARRRREASASRLVLRQIRARSRPSSSSSLACRASRDEQR